MKSRLLLPLLLVWPILGDLSAQPVADGSNVVSPTPLVYGFQHTIHSVLLDQDRKVNIALPESFYDASEAHTYPVLVLLENEFFQMAAGVVRHLSSVERMPETIVVGLLDEPVTPAVYTNGSNFWPFEQLPGEDPDAFKEHLRKELFPYLEENFRANDFRMIMGLSYTSIYALHTFVQEPDLFDAHIGIACGDILGMGYKEGQSFKNLIVEAVKKGTGKKRYLYLTSADADGAGTAPEIQANLIELDSLLAPLRSDDFRYIATVYPDEGHYDVALPGLLDALELIFPKEKWFARYRKIIEIPGKAMDNIDEYYHQLSADYGFTILPRADRWNSVNRLNWIGPWLIREGKISEGIEVIERWVTYRPGSVPALDQLSRAYEANYQLDRALMTLEKVVQLAESSGTDNADLRARVQLLRAKIGKE
ncbi:MAG: alpha/beta hydrolase-fold protein [Saprospiraceae bacterium]|nr:hypothetical protein [Lewinella sp.]